MAPTHREAPEGYDKIGTAVAFVVGAIGGLVVLTPALLTDIDALVGGAGFGWLGTTVLAGALSLGALVLVIWLLFKAANAGGR